jgi:circadian clock protein KaiB
MGIPEPAVEILLRLFVTGTSQRSLRAIEAVGGMCRTFSERVKVEVVDVLEQPEQAEAEKILATPTLIRQIPGPPRRLVGNLEEPARVIQLLGLEELLRPPGPARGRI